jgi:antitoxin component of RelBE/YafQ-DinJ toxin-antitoxin module
MGIRTVRLDEETEKALEQVVTATGLSVSGAMKKGLLILRNEVAQEARRIPYDVYKELDLGPGGYTVAPATHTRRGVRMAVRRKLRR